MTDIDTLAATVRDGLSDESSRAEKKAWDALAGEDA